MTTFFVEALVFILVLLLFALFASWIGKFNGNRKEQFIEKVILKRKEQFIEKAIDKVSSLLTSKIAVVMDQYKQEQPPPHCVADKSLIMLPP